ncbi:MAG: class I SAM-dependent methyltransferase [Candidatus Melainabacteria bacterium]
MSPNASATPASQTINQSTPQYWDEMTEDFDAIYSGQGRSPLGLFLDQWLRKDIYDRVAATVEIVNKLGPAQTVLDVGCGTARLGIPLAKAGHQVTGVDFSKDMLAKATELVSQAGVGERCEFLLGDMLNDIPEPLKTRQHFDAAACLGVLEYMADPMPMLEKMASFSPKVIVASFPREGSFRAWIRRLRYVVQGLDCPLYFYWPKQIEEYGKRLGAKTTRLQLMGELHFAEFEF